jgi:2-oxoglutarate dehydrogenase E1 component
VIWEAQFGDFSNSAQIVFDQLLSSSETKWLRLSGLVLLMPHSYEGQGPEHTSARLERLLQLCAEDNMIIAYPTTPASIFHLLRRQQLRQVRKPLIIMSPKSIFRNPLAVSSVSEIDTGTRFSAVIPDNLDAKGINKVILCSGKVYYDLLLERNKKEIKNIAIIRIEQLYPFPVDMVNKELEKYQNAKVIWCQEEPENMGPWQYFYSRILKKLNIQNLELVSRKEAASPATGYLSTHTHEQEEIVTKALSISIKHKHLA